MDYAAVITTCSNKEDAKTLASILLEQKLAACVQLSEITSLYTWQTKVLEENETQLLIKTKKTLYKELESLILKHHKYDTPEIIMLDIKNGYDKYFSWIDEVTYN